MAELIDSIFVAVAVGLAVSALIRYLFNLGRGPAEGQSATCSGCHSSCSTTSPQTSGAEIFQAFKESINTP